MAGGVAADAILAHRYQRCAVAGHKPQDVVTYPRAGS